MKQRMLYLAAYDVRDPARLREALKIVRHFASGGQKSVFECFLDEREKQSLVIEMEGLLDLEEDRFFLLRLDPRGKVRTLGIGVKPVEPLFYYLG